MDDWYAEEDESTVACDAQASAVLAEAEAAWLTACLTEVSHLPSLASEFQLKQELLRVQHEVEESELVEARELFEGFEVSDAAHGPSSHIVGATPLAIQHCYEDIIKTGLFSRHAPFNDIDDTPSEYIKSLAQIAGQYLLLLASSPTSTSDSLITEEVAKTDLVSLLDDFHQGWQEVLFTSSNFDSMIKKEKNVLQQVARDLLNLAQNLPEGQATSRATLEEDCVFLKLADIANKYTRFSFHIGVYAALLFQQRQPVCTSEALRYFYKALVAALCSSSHQAILQSFLIKISGELLLLHEQQLPSVSKIVNTSTDKKVADKGKHSGQKKNQQTPASKHLNTPPTAKTKQKKNVVVDEDDLEQEDDFYEDFDDYYDR